MAKGKDKNPDALMAAVLGGMKTAGLETKGRVTTLHDYNQQVRYIDMIDPLHGGRPCMALQWMLGARGFPAGRMYQLRASFSSGKSSFLYYVYACAQYGSKGLEDRNAWIAHIETEGAPNPPDYVARFGIDPRLFLYLKANDLNDLFKTIDTFDMSLHGGREGTVNPETGRQVKSKFTKEDALDPDMEKISIVGVDSLSNIGTDAGDDFVNIEKSEKPGGDSKDVRRFMRAREQDYDNHGLTLFFTTHQTTEIKTGPAAGYGGPAATARNQAALGMALTIAINTKDGKWVDENKQSLGSKQYLSTFKSKIAPRNRAIVLYRKDLGGYDIAMTDLMFFLGDEKACSTNPFLPGGPLCPEGAKHGLTKVRGGWSAPMVSDKVFKTPEEFVSTLYSDEERLRKIQEHMRIRGYGFAFETQYNQIDWETKEEPGRTMENGEERNEEGEGAEEGGGTEA